MAVRFIMGLTRQKFDYCLSATKTTPTFGRNSARVNTGAVKVIKSVFEIHRLMNVNFDVEHFATASVDSQNSSLFLINLLSNYLINLYTTYGYLIYLFIYELFYDSVNISDYIASGVAVE
jgi:hypothetical protein